MEPIMNTTTTRKNENLRLLDGGRSQIRGRRLGRRPGPVQLSAAQRELERDMRDIFVLLKTPDGVTPSRGIAAIICAEGTTPWRTFATRLQEAIDAGVARHLVREAAQRFVAWVDRQLELRDRGRAA